MVKVAYIIWTLIGILLVGVLAPAIEYGIIAFNSITTGNDVVDTIIPIILLMAIIGLLIRYMSAQKVE